MDKIASIESLGTLQNESALTSLPIRSDNMLLNEAVFLLDYACLFRQAKISANDDLVKSKVIGEIIRYQNKIQGHIYSDQITSAASYCICAAIDEAVLAGLETFENSWASETLLCNFHNDTWGGERVFEIYDQARLEAQSDLIELIYVLLSLGFTGKFFESTLSLVEIRKDSTYSNILPDMPSTNLNSLIHPISTSQFDIAQYFSLIFILAIFLIMICSILNVGLWYIYSGQSNAITKFYEQSRAVESL